MPTPLEKARKATDPKPRKPRVNKPVADAAARPVSAEVVAAVPGVVRAKAAAVVQENQKHVLAYQVYLELGPGRTIDATAEEIRRRAQDPCGTMPTNMGYVTPSVVDEWRRMFHWDKRVDALEAAAYREINMRNMQRMGMLVAKLREFDLTEVDRLVDRQRQDPGFTLLNKQGDLDKLVKRLAVLFGPELVEKVGGVKEDSSLADKLVARVLGENFTPEDVARLRDVALAAVGGADETKDEW